MFAVSLLSGAHNGLLHDVADADGSRSVDGVQLDLGLVQRIRSEEEHRVAGPERRAKRIRVVVVDSDGLDTTGPGALGSSH
jgi:hypothetical protein